MKFVTLTCGKCGKQFERRIKVHNRNLRLGCVAIRCSATCIAPHRRLKPCEHCGTQTTNERFCTRRCRAFALSPFQKKRQKEGKCSVCQAPTNSGKKYCKECRLSIPNANTKDWSSITLGDLRIKRKKNGDATIWSTAKRIYSNSSLPKFCLICGYSKHFDVCHIKPVKSFSNESFASEVNSLTNLMALCRNHHWEFDHQQLSLEDECKLKQSLVDVAGVDPAYSLL